MAQNKLEKVKKAAPEIKYTKALPFEREDLRERVIEPATFVDRETGQTRRVQDKDGNLVEIPIVERVFKPAKVQQVIEKRTVHHVTEDGGEVHEFANEEDANDFLKGKALK